MFVLRFKSRPSKDGSLEVLFVLQIRLEFLPGRAHVFIRVGLGVHRQGGTSNSRNLVREDGKEHRHSGKKLTREDRGSRVDKRGKASEEKQSKGDWFYSKNKSATLQHGRRDQALSSRRTWQGICQK
jgi:hypothetical protein